MTTIVNKVLELRSSKIATNILWLLFDKGLRMGSGLIIGIWIARYLGPEQFGKLNYGQAFIAIFSAFVSLGLDTTLVKEIVSGEHEKHKLLGTGFLLRLTGAIVALAVVIASSFALDYEADPQSFTIIVILGFSLVFQSVDVVDLYLQAHLKSKISVILKNSALVLSSLFKVYLLLNDYPVSYFAFAILLDIGLAALFLLGYAYKGLAIKIATWKWDTAIARSLMQSSWPLVISALTVIAYMRIDQLMIKNMLGSVSVGNYSAAVRITELFSILPVVITNSMFPSLVNASKDTLLYHSRLAKLYSILIYSSFALAIVTTVLSPIIISLLYGQQYQDAIPVLRIHVWSTVFIFLGVASSQQLVIEGKSKETLYRTILGLTSNIILNIILIPAYGINGVATATLISYAISSFLSNFIFKSTRSINLLYLKAILSVKGRNNA
ncbi:flippase [Pontibacter indicus]|uniref:Polysaccharide transporter, PST family n=1 Tax=Pontibacter indicus TaxID=1317125 RepID=A0A1R3WEW6_9BACT|nr:flippase [Pontibacter indicus]SIT76487.1 polysaccharide transporter, PST family [Pontibacter indicus]